MNHTRFPKEDHLPYWARRDNKVTKGDRAYYEDELRYKELVGWYLCFPFILYSTVQIEVKF